MEGLTPYCERMEIKMKRETITIFEKHDMKLLKKLKENKIILKNPCNKCGWQTRMACCGCQEHREYRKMLIPYEEAGILEYAKEIIELNNIQEQLDQLNTKYHEIYNRLPEKIKHEVYFDKSGY